MARPSRVPLYSDGVCFIAEAEPQDDAKAAEKLSSVILLARLFGYDVSKVAADVVFRTQHPPLNHTADNIYGARLADFAGLVNHIVVNGEWEVDRRADNNEPAKGHFTGRAVVAGKPLTAQVAYHEGGRPYHVWLHGDTWSASFSVTKKRPARFNKETTADLYTLFLGKLLAEGGIRPASAAEVLNWHAPSVSPRKYGDEFDVEAFREDMTLLRMFSSEWE